MIRRTSISQLAADVLTTSKDEVWLNMFVVDCKNIQEFNNKKALLFAKELLKQQLEAAFQRNTDVCKKFQTMSDTLTKYSICLLSCMKLVFSECRNPIRCFKEYRKPFKDSYGFPPPCVVKSSLFFTLSVARDLSNVTKGVRDQHSSISSNWFI